MKLLNLFKEILSETYYNPTLPNDIKRMSNRYEGRNVIWYGDPEQMIVIHKDDVFGMWGNEYNMEKFDSLVDLIRNHEDKIEIECSYGLGGIDNLTDVIEEQNAYHEDRFGSDYDGKDRPASTGDEELDKYLGIDNYLIETRDSTGEFDKFFETYHLSIVYGKETRESLIAKFRSFKSDDYDDIELFKEFLTFEIAIKNASDNNLGDIGRFSIQLRDGHHRVMGAIEAGEQYVCLNLAKEDLETYKGSYQKVTTK